MKPFHIDPHFIIKTGIEGRGIFITTAIKKGKRVLLLQGNIIDKPTQTSVQIGDHLHIENKIAGLINHSCTPNIAVSRLHQAFIALRDISVGDEITFDYNANEDRLACPFICKCCGRKIAGKKEKIAETE